MSGPEYPMCVATIIGGLDDAVDIGPTSIANARLIAAVPELLDAARAMVAALDETNYDVFIGTPSDLLRLTDGRRALLDALAKAEGR